MVTFPRLTFAMNMIRYKEMEYNVRDNSYIMAINIYSGIVLIGSYT